MKQKQVLRFLGVMLCFLLVVIIIVCSYSFYKTTPSIEQQVAQELGVTEAEVFLFDTQIVGEFLIAGVCYASNQYGVVWMRNKEDRPELIWVKTSDKMARRADEVWIKPMSLNGDSFYIFLSANPELSLIVWEDGSDIVINRSIDHVPALEIIFHRVGSHSYQLRDKNGITIQ